MTAHRNKKWSVNKYLEVVESDLTIGFRIVDLVKNSLYHLSNVG